MSRDLTTRPRPFQGWFAIHVLGLATIKLPTKFEVSISAHSENMIGDTKCAIWGSLGVVRRHWSHSKSLKIAPFDRAHTPTYEFILPFHSNYVPDFHRF